MIKSLKTIALVDCNSFYCSCERLFRPDLANRPVGVLSNNDGCFVSRTKELKALGVKMGQPYFQVKKLCQDHQVAVFSANFALYTNLSDRVMMTLLNFTPTMEIYSVDEAFLDLSGFHPDHLLPYAYHIKKTVEKNTGIPVSIGIGPNKTLAKVANHIAKKEDQWGGVVNIMDDFFRQIALEKTPIDDIWGIGRKKTEKLKTLNLKNALELKNFNNDHLIQKLLTKVGRQTVDELRGQYCFELETGIVRKKEIISSRTFGSPVYDLKTLKEAVANYASLACEKLRAQQSVCTFVEVWVQTNPFKEIEQYYAMDEHRFSTQTSDTCKIIKAAHDLVERLYKPGFEYKKALIKLSGICQEEDTQFCLFEPIDTLESRCLMNSMDSINRQNGPHTLKSAACGTNHSAWYMKQTLKSKRYTTSWSELYGVG